MNSSRMGPPSTSPGGDDASLDDPIGTVSRGISSRIRDEPSFGGRGGKALANVWGHSRKEWGDDGIPRDSGEFSIEEIGRRNLIGAERKL